MAKQNGNNNETPKKVYKSITEYANQPVDYSSLYRPIVTHAGYGSKYDRGFVGSPFGGNEARLALDRARSQGFWAEAGTALARIPFDIALGLVESIGYIGDAAEWTGLDKDYGNWLSEAMMSARQRISEDYIPTYQAQPGEIDFSDSAWYWNNLSSLVSSVGQFAALGFGTGSILGKTASAMAGAFNATRGTAQALQGAATLSNAAVLTYTEAKMNSVDTYNQVKEMGIDQGYTLDQAEQIAANAADYAEKINMGNILLNLTGASMITKGLGIVGRTEREIMKRTGGTITSFSSPEIARKAISFLDDLDNIPVRITSIENTLKKGALEAVQEYAEETIGYIGQEEGTYKAQKELGLVAESDFGDRLSNYLSSTEGIVQGVLGAIGGIGQAAAVTYAGNLRGSAINTEAQFQQYINLLKENKDSIDLIYNIKRQGDLANKMARSAVANDQDQYEKAQNDLLLERFFDSKIKGIEEGFIRQLNAIADISPTDAVEMGYTDSPTNTEYRDKALRALQKIGEWDQRYNEIIRSNPNALSYWITNENEGTSKSLGEVILSKEAELNFYTDKTSEKYNDVQQRRQHIYSTNPDKSVGAKNIVLAESERDVYVASAAFYEQLINKLNSNSDVNITDRQIKEYKNYVNYLTNKSDFLNRRILDLNSTYLGDEEKVVTQDKELLSNSDSIDLFKKSIGSYIDTEFKRRRAASDYNYVNSEQYIEDGLKAASELDRELALQAKKTEKLKEESVKKEREDSVQNTANDVFSGPEDSDIKEQKLDNITSKAEKSLNKQEATSDGEYLLKDTVNFISEEGELRGVITNISGDILAVKTDDGRTYPVHITAITSKVESVIPTNKELSSEVVEDTESNEIGRTDSQDRENISDYTIVSDPSSVNSTAFKGVAGIARITTDENGYRKIVLNDIVRENRITPIDDKYRDNPNTTKIGDSVRLEVEVGDNYNRKALDENLPLAIDIVKYDSDGNRHVIDVLNSGANRIKLGNESLLNLRNDITEAVKREDRQENYIYQFPTSFEIVDKYIGVIEQTEKFSNLSEIYKNLKDPRNGEQMPVILGIAYSVGDSPTTLRLPNLSRYNLTTEDILVNPDNLTVGAVYSVIPNAKGTFTVARLFTREVNSQDLSEVMNLLRTATVNNFDSPNGVREKVNNIIPFTRFDDVSRRFIIRTNKNKDGLLVYINNKVVSLDKFISEYESPGGPERILSILQEENHFPRQVNIKKINTGKYNDTLMDGILTSNLPTDGVLTIYGNVVLNEYQREDPISIPSEMEEYQGEVSNIFEVPEGTVLYEENVPDDHDMISNVFALPEGVTELEEGTISETPPSKPVTERRIYKKREGSDPITQLNPVNVNPVIEANNTRNTSVSEQELKETKENCKTK